jgi:hypothetical protein
MDGFCGPLYFSNIERFGLLMDLSHDPPSDKSSKAKALEGVELNDHGALPMLSDCLS